MSNEKLTDLMQTLSQRQNKNGTLRENREEDQFSRENFDYKEASFHYTLGAFEEICQEDCEKVWKHLTSHTKAHFRRMMAKEQLLAGEPLC